MDGQQRLVDRSNAGVGALMNIRDTKAVAVKAKGDKLQWLLDQARQGMIDYQLMAQLAGTTIDSKSRQAIAREFAWNCVEEIGEAINLLKNRRWVTNETEVDKEHLADEVADMWIFFVQLTMVLLGEKLSAAQLIDFIERKRAVNAFRRRSGY